MAKGDLFQGGTATNPYGSPANPDPQMNMNQGGASKSMNDILALLQHLGIGASGQAGQQQGPQFGSNMLAGMRKTMGPQQNLMQQGWGVGNRGGTAIGGQRTMPYGPGGTDFGMNPGGNMRQGVPFGGGGFWNPNAPRGPIPPMDPNATQGPYGPAGSTYGSVQDQYKRAGIPQGGSPAQPGGQFPWQEGTGDLRGTLKPGESGNEANDWTPNTNLMPNMSGNQYLMSPAMRMNPSGGGMQQAGATGGWNPVAKPIQRPSLPSIGYSGARQYGGGSF